MSSRLPRLSVLVIDDDDVDRERVLRMLRHSPFDIRPTEASSGAQALALIGSQRVDCVVLDNRLGDATGLQLLPALQRESLQRCPVIMITGDGDERLVVQVLQSGAADYVSKRHLNAGLLIHTINRSLEQQRLRDELAEVQRCLEHHVREQALTIEQRERDLQSLLDHMPALIGYWDRSLHNRFGNRAHPAWFGIAQERMPGMHMRDVIGEADLRQAEPYIEAVLRGEEQRFEYTATARPGHPRRRCQAHFIPDRQADAGVAGFYSFVTDVTQLKDAQARAEELAAFNQAVIQSSPVGIAVYASDGRCLLANRALAGALSSTPAELRAQNFRQLAAWQVSGLLSVAEATLADGSARHCEVHEVQESGEDIWLECCLVAIAHLGERQLLLIAHDVTRQRTVQAELAAARDEARAAAQAKSAFLANMSHEIRTPMNGIIGLSRLALEDELAPRARNFLDKVHSSALALMGILDDVLDYSKIEAGQLRFESVEFELDDLLAQVADLFAARIEQKGLEFVFDVRPEVPTHLVGDPLRLSQVLDNLVGNAVKFTEQGMIEVRIALAEPVQEGSCLLQFAVDDTGVGIAPDSRPGLFDAFTQADSSVTRRFGGSGLGLAICKRLVQQMDGTIDVDSLPGGGSHFHFTARLGVGREAVSLADVAAQHGLRALVVDDNPVWRRVLAAQLTDFGIAVDTAPGGIAAVGQLRQAHERGQPVALVLLDADLPAADTTQVLRHVRLRGQQPGSAPATVMMMVASSRLTGLLDATGEAPPEPVLTKPVLRTHLYQAVLSAARGRPGGRAAEGPLPDGLLQRRAEGLAGACVLLVEDNPVNQLVAGETLRRLGLEVVVASDGAEALELLREGGERRFDVILMDLHMPRMDGFEATRRILALPERLLPPVIAMSAAVLPEDRVLAFAAGMVDHLAKPVMAEQLVEVLLKWVRKAPR